MQPKIYLISEHEINPDIIDSDALSVIQRLKEEGFKAYLVGGSVRDLLLKKTPKDFDISTSAKPEEIKKIFRRQCLLIGRRFRLAHIRFNHKIIEVSTFRAGGNTQEESLIINDNQWGSAEEDVLRRDFTINGLFYDPTDHSIIDYVDGWGDIQTGVLRSIGDPVIRFKQDPVRMLRLLKFHSRFSLKINNETEKALHICQKEITKSSPARILEEMLRMLESGFSEVFIELLEEKGFLKILFPLISDFLKSSRGNKIFHLLHGADKIHKHKGKIILDRACLLSCLLFPILENEIMKMVKKEKTLPIADIMNLSASLVKHMGESSFMQFPRRLSSITSYILTMQYRLTPLSNKKHPKPKMMQNREFSYALQLLKLRAIVDQNLVEIYQYWKDIYKKHAPQMHSSIVPDRIRPKKRGRKLRVKHR